MVGNVRCHATRQPIMYSVVHLLYGVVTSDSVQLLLGVQLETCIIVMQEVMLFALCITKNITLPTYLLKNNFGLLRHRDLQL